MKQFDPTPEQILAISCSSDSVITACPGSGKTEVLAQKVRNALVSLPEYCGVIGISYTNKASNELRRRCFRDGHGLKHSFFGTIDRFCASEIVLPFLSHLFNGKCTDLSIRRFSSLLPEVKELFGSDPRHFNQTELQAALPLVERLYEQGIILLDLLPSLAHHVLLNSLACRNYIRARYKALFVDEYQDVSQVLHELFLEIRALGLVMVVVGDVNQSVYGFDRRSSAHLKTLCDPSSGFKHFKLTANIRCHPSITNYANRLLQSSHPLLPTDVIRIYRREIEGTQKDIASWICAHLDELKRSYAITKNSEIAILVKSNSSAEIVHSAMTVPSKIVQDFPLQQSNYLECQFFSMLLALRADKCATVQSLIDTLPKRNCSRKELTRLRGAIMQCRKSDLTSLEGCLIDAALLSGYTITADGIAELQAVLADERRMKLYEPVLDNQVQILTLHKSKGLEFEFVYHLDLYDWIIPKRLFVEGVYDPVYEDEAQCLNLHYVGITRARKGCALVTSKQRFNAVGEVKKGVQSQFFERPGLDGLFS